MLEVWDLRDQLRKPTAVAAISATTLTALAFPELQQQHQQKHQQASRTRSKSRKFTRNAIAHKTIESPHFANPALTHLAVGDAAGSLTVLKLPPSLSMPVRTST